MCTKSPHVNKKPRLEHVPGGKILKKVVYMVVDTVPTWRTSAAQSGTEFKALTFNVLPCFPPYQGPCDLTLPPDMRCKPQIVRPPSSGTAPPRSAAGRLPEVSCRFRPALSILPSLPPGLRSERLSPRALDLSWLPRRFPRSGTICILYLTVAQNMIPWRMIPPTRHRNRCDSPDRGRTPFSDWPHGRLKSSDIVVST